MEDQCFRSTYRPAAVLAAFSRANDEGLPTTFQPALAAPRTDPLRRTMENVICCLLVVGLGLANRRWAGHDARHARGARAQAIVPTAEAQERGQQAPALASHFDFWHTEGVPSDLQSAPDRQVA